MVIKPEPSAMERSLLEYEVAGSVIASFIWFDWGQEIMSRHLARKTSRKVKRYLEFLRNKRKSA